MASPSSRLRRGLAWLALALTVAVVAIATIPSTALPTTVLLLGLGGGALGLLLTFRLITPRLNVQRDRALVQVLADVTAGKYPPAPDEVWHFKRRGWWTPKRELTELGHTVLAQNRGEPRG